jgi:hypothetical protein
LDIDYYTVGGTVVSETAGCPASNVFLNQAGSGQISGANATPRTVPANSTGTLVQFDNAARLDEDAPSACQGATFTFGVSVQWTTEDLP